MKTKHHTIRLDDETNAIVQKHQVQFGTSTSETIQRLIQAADGKHFVSVLSTTLSRSEDLSYFAGQLEKTRLLWREIKSRLNAPRPLDPNDAPAIKEWHDDRVRIQTFNDECKTLSEFSHSLLKSLTGTSHDNLVHMQKAAKFLHMWSRQYQQMGEHAKNPRQKEEALEAKEALDSVLAVLQRLGIEPTQQNEERKSL